MKVCTILGGPRDGETIEWMGHELRMPVPRPIARFDPGDKPSAIPDLKVDRYAARQDLDGRWWYV